MFSRIIYFLHFLWNIIAFRVFTRLGESGKVREFARGSAKVREIRFFGKSQGKVREESFFYPCNFLTSIKKSFARRNVFS